MAQRSIAKDVLIRCLEREKLAQKIVVVHLPICVLRQPIHVKIVASLPEKDKRVIQNVVARLLIPVTQAEQARACDGAL